MEKTPDFENARQYCLNRLAKELSPKLTYHSLFHTNIEVVPAAQRLADLENVEVEDRVLLLTAAYYHDIGFIYKRQGHEAVSIEIAEDNLPKFGYSAAQIAVIRNIIKATHIPQSPTDKLEMIMADADLDYLGQENFWARSNDLRAELENFGPKFTDMNWHLYQIRFIQDHQYFTNSQKGLRDAKKQQHLLEIKARLKLVTES